MYTNLECIWIPMISIIIYQSQTPRGSYKVHTFHTISSRHSGLSLNECSIEVGFEMVRSCAVPWFSRSISDSKATPLLRNFRYKYMMMIDGHKGHLCKVVAACGDYLRKWSESELTEMRACIREDYSTSYCIFHAATPSQY